jgi:hypothetical protein
VFSYVVSLLRPEIIRDLELPRHGLHILPLESTITPLENGDYLGQWNDHDQNRRELARHSLRDAEAYDEFGLMLHQMARAIKPLLGMAPPDPTSLSLANLSGMAEPGAPFPRPGGEAFPHAAQAAHHELGRLPRRMVRERGAQGDQVGERHHRHHARAALARHGVRAAAPLHGRARRRVPRLGICERRQWLGERGDRRRGAGCGRGDPL